MAGDPDENVTYDELIQMYFQGYSSSEEVSNQGYSRFGGIYKTQVSTDVNKVYYDCSQNQIKVTAVKTPASKEDAVEKSDKEKKQE